MNDNLNFPDGFIWGTATASYQIEGAVGADGRGQSIWDTFSHTPGKVVNNDTGDAACDHYHRWPEDIELMKALNLDAYRFSIAWPRIMPTGRGTVNQAGLDFYSRLVDGLLEAGITPFVTLYHWDLPQALQDEGSGWERREIATDFAAYTDVVAQALGDRVKHWITLNEPWVFAWLGYFFGTHAPGIRTDDVARPLAVTHHALLAHGAAVKVLRDRVADVQVGITLNLSHVDPATPLPHDLEAAARFDGYANRWYLDPLLKGSYPSDMRSLYGPALPEIQSGDMEQIHAPLDFLGVNNYFRAVIADDKTANALGTREEKVVGHEYTAMGWEVYPHGLYALLRRIHQDYPPIALYITENGAAFDDVVSDDGAVHDERRVSFLRGHFDAALHAIRDGVPLKGYFVWSLLDNFEWAEGYSKRFGIHYVDYATQQRIAKDSAKFVAEVAARTG